MLIINRLRFICVVLFLLVFQGLIHVARHTFATSVTLTNGVPLETVSKMLGHTSLKTTQIYARIVDSKISNDMELLNRKLNAAKIEVAV